MLRGMRTKIPFGGKWRTISDVQRGLPVLYTPEEWSRRGKETNDEVLRWLSWMLPLSILPFWVVLAVIIGAQGLFWVIYPPVYCLLMLVTWTISMRYHQNRELERSNYTGLFENGLQVRVPMNGVHFFIPYSQIEDFKVETTWKFPKLVVTIKGFRRPKKLMHVPTTLGEVGLGKLRMMLSGATEVDGPPRLVIYGDGSPSINLSEGFHENEPVLPVYDVRSQL
jgi:hypothetical protein